MYAQPFVLPTIPPTSNVGPMPGPVTGQGPGPMPNPMPGQMPTPVLGPAPGPMSGPMPMMEGPPPVGAISVALIPPPLPSVQTKKKSEPQKEKTEKAIKMMKSAQESYNTPDIGPNGMPLPGPMQITSNMPQAMVLKPGWGGGH